MKCPHCDGYMDPMDHGVCPTCKEYCGCSFNPTSMNDYCGAHRPGPHKHDWEHLGAQKFGMYRCRDCHCFGYSKVYRGMNTVQKIVPYKCHKCGGWAVAKEASANPQKSHHGHPVYWVCTHHRKKKKEVKKANETLQS